MLSYDVTVFQCITSCNKTCYDHTCINMFAKIHNVIDDVQNNNVYFHSKSFHFEGDKILFQKSYDKTNLTIWSIHAKLIKLAKSSLNKFHVKWPLV